MYIVYVIIFTECRTTVGGFSGTWLAAHYQPATPHSPHVISIRVHHYTVALPALISKPHDTSQYEISLTRLLLRFIVPSNWSLIVKFPFSAWLRRVILKITTVFTCCCEMPIEVHFVGMTWLHGYFEIRFWFNALADDIFQLMLIIYVTKWEIA